MVHVGCIKCPHDLPRELPMGLGAQISQACYTTIIYIYITNKDIQKFLYYYAVNINFLELLILAACINILTVKSNSFVYSYSVKH